MNFPTCIRFLMIGLCGRMTSAALAEPSACTHEPTTEKTICSNNVESAEFAASCPKLGKLSILGGGKHCSHALFPTLKWKTVEDEDPVVTVDPAPGQLAGAATLFGHGARKGYTLQETSIDYQIGDKEPVHVVCDAPDNAPFRCDISTGFASLDCDVTIDPSINLTIQASGTYKKARRG